MCVVESGVVTVTELKPGQQYTVHLSAGNDVGFGPSVKFIVNTPTMEQSGRLQRDTASLRQLSCLVCFNIQESLANTR